MSAPRQCKTRPPARTVPRALVAVHGAEAVTHLLRGVARASTGDPQAVQQNPDAVSGAEDATARPEADRLRQLPRASPPVAMDTGPTGRKVVLSP